MEDNRNKYVEGNDNITEEIGTIKDQINLLVNDQKKKESEYKEATRKNEKYKVLNNQLDLCDKAISSLKSIKEEILHEVRDTIQRRTREYFLHLIWKKKTFTDVKIDHKYSISVVHKDGWNALEALSAGERQVLALSFMAALREAANVESPVVIDTLLGRISSEPKANIAELLPLYLKNTQVTLLLTDQEYTVPIREKLRPYTGREYKLNFDENVEETTVVPYGI